MIIFPLLYMFFFSLSEYLFLFAQFAMYLWLILPKCSTRSIALKYTFPHRPSTGSLSVAFLLWKTNGPTTQGPRAPHDYDFFLHFSLHGFGDSVLHLLI